MGAMIVLIDNYDSFTYNLVQYMGKLGADIEVHRNDQISVDDVLKLNPKGIVISPGPGTPDESGICLNLVESAAEKSIPLLGVCLGHQTIGQVFGGDVVQTTPLHGKTSPITHRDKSIFKGLPSPLNVTRYHSLVVEFKTDVEDIEITSQTDDGTIMGMCHLSLPIHGVQFHPESIATEHGLAMLDNFVSMV